MKNFKEKNYKILIGIMVLIIGIIGINKLGSYDLNKGKVHLSKAVIENKLNASVIEAKGYEEITYPIFYTLEKVEGIEKRNVVIKASLTKDENKYAKFKEINSENITSTLTENGSKIEIRIENVELGKEEKLELKLQLTGAPNGYKINPKVEIKEETEEKYTKIEAKEIEVKTNSITGIIKDEEGMSVSNIEISINKEGQEIKKAVTNEEGRYVFSDIEEGRYELKIEEEIYELENKEEIEVKEGIVKDIKVKKVRPYKIEVNKYIEKVKINNKEYTYEKLNRVNQSIKNAKEITGEIEYKVVVKNTGTKEGIITKVEEEKIEGLKFNKEKNKGWEEKEGKIYNNSLEGLTIKAGEEKEIKLILDIEKTEEAKSYLTRVTVKGEVYEKVSYILDNKIYKEEEVLEGEKIEEEKLEIEGFSGWYTDKNYTNKYNFEKGVTKDLILYGKTKEAIKKYTVTYIDEGKIIKKEELEEGSIISAPEVTKEGHTFIGWYEKENKYDVYEPITRDLILESKYEINKYKITFKNYDGSVLEENETKYKEKPVYKGETPKRERDEEYSYIFNGWDKELEEATKEEEYTAVYKKEKNKYTVTYINEGVEYHKETLEYGSVVTSIQDPIKEGYTFTGWYNENNQKVNHPITVTKNITLYSKYEINVYTVSFYHNNEKYVEDQKVNYGESAVKPSTDPTKEDYNFSGWVIKGTNNKYDFNQKVTKNIELESSFTKKPTYTVTFKIGNEVILTENVIEGHKVEAKEAPNKKGYLFDKWYSDEGLTIENNFEEKIMNNKTIYGKYNENKHTVTYINEETTYYTEEVLDSFTAKGPSVNPEKEGYTFKYFSKDKKVAFDYNVEITEDITLYAVYEINTYKVVFKNYDGSVLQEETLDYGSTPVYKKNVPTREKTEEYTYEFKSWDKEITKVTSNQEYIATYKETKNQYKIIFTNYDGNVLQEETLDYGSEVTYKGNIPTREKTKEYTYTFTGWDKEITKVLKNETYIAVYKEEKNKYTVTFMDEERIYGKKEVEYNSVVTDTENHPSKEHHIFKGWTLNDEIYNFNSPVTEDITLKSLYEKVEEPVITHTPTEWTKNNVTISITSDHLDYKYLYKIDNGEYKEYTGEFTIDENCVVVAKSVKENVESEIITHEITNIDKIAPTINEVQEENVTVNSFDIRVKAIDTESGLKEIRIYKDNIYQTSISYTDNYNDEKTMSYTLENLEEDTTYRIKIQAIDVAGNISEGIEKEFSTSRNVIVARIIGRNNSLYKSEDDYENFNSLENAINACPEGQCTIEMVLDAKESVEVLEGQDITLDINGKTITGVRNYTIQNSGNLIIVDKANEAGSILNKDDTALRNINNGLLQLGKNEEELVVSKTNPNIVGTIYGVYTDDSATFNFFDGRIEANQAIKGNVDETPYSYNADVAISDKQVATLSVLIDPEARVGTTYYSKVQSAIDDSANGVYLDKTTEMALVKGFDNSDTYGFDYDEENNRLISNNDLSNTTAVATTVVDLTSYTSNQKLTIEGFVDKIYEYTSYNKSYGYVEVLKKDDNKNIGSSRYDSESPSSQYFVLPYGSKYIVNIKYIIPGYRQENVKNSHFIISKMNLSDYKTDKYNGYTNADDSVTTINYSFNYDETTKTYKSNNQYIPGSRAFSYIPIDLTNETDDYQLTVNAQVDSIAGSDYGIINVNETNEILKYTNSNGLAFISETSNEYHNGIYNFNKTLTAGKKYYLQFYYFKNDSNGYPQEEYNSKGSNDQFIINSIDLVKLASATTTLNLDEKLKYSGKMGFTDKINNKYMNNVQTEENTLIDSYVELDFTKMQYDQLVNLNTYNSYNNYQYFYLSTSPNNVSKDLILNDKDSISNLIYFYGKPSSLYINGSSYTSCNTDKKFVLSKGNKYYLHFAVIKNMSQYPSTYSDFAINSVSYTSVLDNKLNVGVVPSTTGTDEIISHPIKTSEFALDESKDEELRYIGSNANNYVTFNDEIWRILGVFKTEDKKGNKDFRIKLVRSSSIGYYSWDTSDSAVSGGYGINEWSQADIMKLLNPGYDDEEIGGSLYYNSKSGKCYNGSNNGSTDCDFTSIGLKDSAKEFIDTVKWNTGALPYETASYNLTPNQIYNYEKGTNTGKTNYENHNDFPVDNVERTYYWYGQVGLISPTDLIMAGSDSSDMSRESCMMSSSNYYYCINNNNWFRNMSTNSYYAINPAFSPSNNSSYYPYIGYSIYNSPYTTPVASSNAILPTVYLKTNVSVKSGDGTSSNPYVLELLDKKNTHKYYGLASNIEKEETNAEENIIKTEKTNNDYKQLKSFTFIYGFTYDEETKTYTNENINIPNSRAISAIKIDLTNETEEKTILFNYDFKSSSYLSEMYINVMVGKYTPVDYFATTGPNSIYSVGPVLANSTSSITSSVKYTFKPGQVYYVQFSEYNSYRDYEQSYLKVSFDYVLDTEKTENFTKYEYSYPVLNEKPDTVVLLNDVVTNQTLEVPETQNIMLDLNGHDLSTEQSNYVLENNGQIEIFDSKYEQSLLNIKNASTEDYNHDNLNVFYDMKDSEITELNISDLSSNKINGTINGTIKEEDYLKFDGIDDYVLMDEINPDYMTIESVFSVDEVQTGEVCVACNYETGGYGISIKGGYIKGQIYTNSKYYNVLSDEIIEPNKKYYVQVTYDGTTLNLYINNKLKGSKEASGTITAPKYSTKFVLGANPKEETATSGFFKGNIYSFRIYSDALSIENLNNNYNIDYYRFEKNMPDTIIPASVKSSTGNVILNNANANLIIRNVNVSISKTNTIGIDNYGNTSLKENSTINIIGDGYGKKAIYNRETGNIINNENGIITTSSTGVNTAIYNESSKLTELSNLIIKGVNTGFQNNSKVDLSIHDMNIESKISISNSSEKILNVDDVESIGRILNNKPKSIININSGNFTNEKDYVIGIASQSSYDPIKDSIININGGTIKSSYIPIYVYKDSIVNINSGDVVYSGSDEYAIENNGTLNINGGAVTSSYIGINNKSVLSITGGNINAISSAITINYSSTEINIKSGTIVSGDNAIYNASAGELNIGVNDGNVNNDNLVIRGQKYAIYNDEGSNNYGKNVNLYDGILYGKNDIIHGTINNYEKGYDLYNENSDSYIRAYLIENNKREVAQIGDTKYGSILDALNSIITSDETIIKVIDDIYTVEQLIIPEDKNVVLDINGHTIKEFANESYVLNKGTFKIKDSTTVIGENNVIVPVGLLHGYSPSILKNTENMNVENIELTTLIKGNIFLLNTGSGTANINSSLFYSTNHEYNKEYYNYIRGIQNTENSILNLKDSKLEFNINFVDNNGTVSVQSIYNTSTGNVNVDKSIIKNSITSTDGSSSSMYDIYSENGIVNIDNSELSNNYFASEEYKNSINNSFYSIDIEKKGIVNVTNSSLINNSTDDSTEINVVKINNDLGFADEINNIKNNTINIETSANVKTNTVKNITRVLNLSTNNTINIDDNNIDMNYYSKSINDLYFILNNKSNIILENNSVTSNFVYKGISNVSGSIEYNSGTLDGAIDSKNYSDEKGNITINGGTLNGKISTSSGNSVVINNGIFNNDLDITINTLNVNGGIFNIPNKFSIKPLNDNDINFSNATINAQLNGISFYNTAYLGTLNISNMNISSKYNSISVSSIKEINIENSTIESISSNGIYDISKNLENLNIKSSTVKAYSNGIYNESPNTVVTIGDKDDVDNDGNILVSKTLPNISGLLGIGINNTSSNTIINFYDGIIKGKKGAIVGTINEIPTNYEIITETETDEDGSNPLEVKYLSTLPVAKIGDEVYNSLNEAFSAVTDDAKTTVELLRDVTLPTSQKTITIPENRNIILDLYGYTINFSNNEFIINNGTLFVTDTNVQTNSKTNVTYYNGKVLSNSNVFVNNKGNFTLNNISAEGIKNTSESEILNASVSDVNNYGSGNINISNSIISNINNNEIGNIYISGGTTTNVSNKSSGYIEIKDGTATSILNEDLGKIKLNSAQVTSNKNEILNETFAVRNSKNGTIEITGSSISSSYYGIKNISGEIILNSTTINSTTTSSSVPCAYGIYNESGIITLNDSSVTGYYSNGKNSAGTGILNLSGIININNTSVNANYISKITGIYNTNGTINIDSDKIISSIVNASNTVNITKGNILAITNLADAILNMGTKDGIVNNDLITISENITNEGVFNYYEGKIKGSKHVIVGKVSDIEDGYYIVGTSGTTEEKYIGKTSLVSMGENKYVKLQDAINASPDNIETKITLLRDFIGTMNDEEIQIPESKNIVLDLNGYYIQSSNENLLNNLGNLKVIDETNTLDSDGYYSNGNGEILSSSTLTIKNNGNMTIEKLNISNLNVINTNVVSQNNFSIISSKIPELNINGILNLTKSNTTTLTNSGSKNVSTHNSNINYVINSNDGQIELNDSNVSKTIKNNDAGNIFINNTNIESTYYEYGKIIDNAGTGNITINGGNIINNHIGYDYENRYLIYNGSTGIITVNDGNINMKYYKNKYCTDIIIENASTGIININGGQLSSDSLSSNIIRNDGNGVININGGQLDNTGGTLGYSVYNNKGTLNINGGVINAKIFNNSNEAINITGGKIHVTGDKVSAIESNRKGIINVKGNIENSSNLPEIISESGNSISGSVYSSRFENVKITGNVEALNLNDLERISNVTFEKGSMNILTYNDISFDNITFNTSSLDYNLNISSSKNVYLNNITINNTATSSTSGINISGNAYISNSNITVSADSSNGIKNSGTLYVKDNVNISANGTNSIGINGGTIILGEKDSIVSLSTPIIYGEAYGIFGNNTSGLYFYDGIISSKSDPISIGIKELEPGYKVNISNNEDGTKLATLTPIGEEDRVAVINNINFSDLQSAINYAPDNATSNITIYANITLDSNIVVPAGKNIKIYLNGYTITKGNYDFTGEGKVTLIEGTNTTNALASIIENVKEVLNIEDINKNIIIYEMDDGSKITSEKTYKLYKIVDNNKEEVKLKEEEIGKYNVENKEDEIRTVKGRIYINNLPKGNYELISNDNRKASFEITDTGKLVGKIKENINESKPVIVSAITELIITIQTGTTYINYILIIITLLSIITSLYLVQKKTNKKYLS